MFYQLDERTRKNGLMAARNELARKPGSIFECLPSSEVTTS